MKNEAQAGAREGLKRFWRPVRLLARSKGTLTVSVILVGAFLLISVAGLLIGPFNDLAARLINRNGYDEGLIEWIEALVWALATVAFLDLFIVQLKTRPRSFRAVWFLMLAGLTFFALGEELSWGQQFLGFKTPAGVAAVNAQRETNIHNLNLAEILKVREGTRLHAYLTNSTMFLNLVFYAVCFALTFVIPLMRKAKIWPKWKLFDTLPSPGLKAALFSGACFIVLEIWDQAVFDVGEIIELALPLMFLLFARDAVLELARAPEAPAIAPRPE